MLPFSSVVCAVDTSEESARVIQHAAALAALSGGQLTVLLITDGDHRVGETRLAAMVSAALPGPVPSLPEPRRRVARLTQGSIVDAILEFSREGVDLIVMGAHGRRGFSRWLLGSTCAAVLEQAPCPVFVVPPGSADAAVVNANGARLSFGSVIAAVDLDEHNDHQLQLAGKFAAASGQPLVLMTVAGPAVTDEAAGQSLSERGTSTGGVPVHHVIIRRGTVAQEILRAALGEPAALVVMGLRGPGHGLPGEIATKVLHGNTIVLAVPESSTAQPNQEGAGTV